MGSITSRATIPTMVSHAYRLAYDVKLQLLGGFQEALETNAELDCLRITKGAVEVTRYNPAWDGHPGATEGERAHAAAVHNSGEINDLVSAIDLAPGLWAGLELVITTLGGVVTAKVSVPDILEMERLMRALIPPKRPRRGAAMRADSKITRMAKTLACLDSEGNARKGWRMDFI